MLQVAKRPSGANMPGRSCPETHAASLGRVRPWRMSYAALLFGVAMTTTVVKCAAVAEDAATRALLNEVLAGYDANLALIQHGTASYTTKMTMYVPPPVADDEPSQGENGKPPAPDAGPRETLTSEVTVHFDYPRLRFDWRGDRRVAGAGLIVEERRKIVDGEQFIFYDPPRGAVKNPHAHNVMIVPTSSEIWSAMSAMHPREQFPNFSIADHIRALRNNPDASLNAAREADGLIRFDAAGPKFRASYWVSPSEGYSIVRSKMWAPTVSESQPVQILEATVRGTNGGAYVLDRRAIKNFTIVDGKIKPSHDEEVTLVKIDLLGQPDEKLFTLDGLDLPVGATVQDRIQGRRYEYAVAAVREPEIKVPAPSGPMKTRHWPTALYIAAGVGLLAVGFLSYRIRRRRKDSASNGDHR